MVADFQQDEVGTPLDVETITHSVITFTPTPAQISVWKVCSNSGDIFIWYVSPRTLKQPSYTLCDTIGELTKMAEDKRTDEFAVGFSVWPYDCFHAFTLRLLHFNNIGRKS